MQRFPSRTAYLIYESTTSPVYDRLKPERVWHAMDKGNAVGRYGNKAPASAFTCISCVDAYIHFETAAICGA